MTDPAPRVLVTRSRTQASRLSAALRAAGAEPVELPVLEVHPASDPAPMHDALRRPDAWSALAITSTNGVRACVDALDAVGVRPEDAPRVVPVGSATARAARGAGFTVVAPPDRYDADAMIDVVVDVVRGDTRPVLFARAQKGRRTLVEGLEAAGVAVHRVVAYEVHPASAAPAALAAALDAGLDLVTVASSRTARFLDAVADDRLRPRLAAVPFAAIGPITAATVRDLGYTVSVEPDEATVPALAAACARWLASR